MASPCTAIGFAHGGTLCVSPCDSALIRPIETVNGAAPVELTVCVKHCDIAIQQSDAGAVAFFEVIQQDAGQPYALGGVRKIAVSPEGERLYAVSPEDGALAVFEREPGGGLTFLGAHTDRSSGGDIERLAGAMDVAVSADGSAVYVVSGFDDALLLFNGTTAGLALAASYHMDTHDIPGLDTPARLALSPDGAHVYVGTSNPDASDAVLIFSVDDGAGRLAQAGRYDSGVDDVRALAFSSDGRHLYVADASGLTLLARDANLASVNHGQLSYVTAYRPGESGVEGIAGAMAIALAPDGAQVYVAGASDNAVTVFDRDADSGLLAKLASYRNGEDGIDGLNGPLGLAVSPDGGHVYVASNNDNALLVLRRERDTGLLSYLETRRNGDRGVVDGLNSVLDVAVSPDGANLYTASPIEKKIGVFTVPAADLGLAITSSAGTGVGEAGVRIVVSNAGPNAAEGVRLSGPLPSGIAAVDFDAPVGIGCEQSSQQIDCEVGTLPAGAMIEIDVLVAFAPPVAISYTAVVSAAQRDPDLSNNTDTVIITVASDEEEEGDPPEESPSDTGNPPTNPRSGGGSVDWMLLLIAGLVLVAKRRHGLAHGTAE